MVFVVVLLVFKYTISLLLIFLLEVLVLRCSLHVRKIGLYLLVVLTINALYLSSKFVCMCLFRHILMKLYLNTWDRNEKKKKIQHGHLESSSLKVYDLKFSKITCLYFFPLQDLFLF